LQSLFPEITSDPVAHERCKTLLLEVDRDGSGTISFREFLHLMRRHKDYELKKTRTNPWK
jgi:hypothetical protein